MSHARALGVLAAVAVLAAGGAPAVRAAGYTWDNSVAADSKWHTVDGLLDTNWNVAADPTAMPPEPGFPDDAGDKAVFSDAAVAAAQTVDVSGARTAGTLSFQNATYTYAIVNTDQDVPGGKLLTLGDAGLAGTIEKTGAAAATVSAAVTGGGAGLAVSAGGGTLTLSGQVLAPGGLTGTVAPVATLVLMNNSNSFAGTFAVSGTLTLQENIASGASSVAGTAQITLNNGAMLWAINDNAAGGRSHANAVVVPASANVTIRSQSNSQYSSTTWASLTLNDGSQVNLDQHNPGGYQNDQRHRFNQTAINSTTTPARLYGDTQIVWLDRLEGSGTLILDVPSSGEDRGVRIENVANPSTFSGTIRVNNGQLMVQGSDKPGTYNPIGTGTIEMIANDKTLHLSAKSDSTVGATFDNKVVIKANEVNIEADYVWNWDVKNKVITLGSAANPLTVEGARTVDFYTSPQSGNSDGWDLVVPKVVIGGNFTMRYDARNIANEYVQFNEVDGGPGNAYTFTKDYDGSAILKASNHGGFTDVKNGSLTLDGPFATSELRTTGSGGTLTVTAAATFSALTKATVSSGALTTSANLGDVAVALSGGTLTVNVPQTFVPGKLTVTGGTLNYNYANANLGGLSLPAAGALRLSQAQSVAGGAAVPARIEGRYEINTGAIAADYDDVVLGNNSNMRAVGAARTYPADLRLEGTVTFGGGGQALQVTGQIKDGAVAGKLRVTADTLTVAASNAYTGGTEVAAGLLRVATTAATPLGTGPLATSPWATLQIDPTSGTVNLASVASVGNDGIIHVRTGAADFGGLIITTTVPSAKYMPIASPMVEYYAKPSDMGVANFGTDAVVSAFIRFENSNTFITPSPGPGKQGTLVTGTNLSFIGSQINTRSGNYYPGTDHMGAAWTGLLTIGGDIPAGWVSFGTRSDDGSSFYVDVNRDGVFQASELIVSNLGMHSVQNRTGSVNLAAGTYKIAIGFYENTGDDVIEARIAPGQNVGYDSQFVINPGGLFDPGSKVQLDAGTTLSAGGLTAATILMNATNTSAAALNLNALTPHSGTVEILELAGTNPVGSLSLGANNALTAKNLKIAAGGTLTVGGSGQFLLTGAGSGTGTLSVTGGLLGGGGSIAGSLAMASGTTLAPGASTGTLEIGGNLTLAAMVELAMELGGKTPGDGAGFYDQVLVAGNANVSGAGLAVSLAGGFVPDAGDVFYLLTAGGTRTGEFSGLAEGATVPVGGGLWGTITYQANWAGSQAASSLTGGNDVALYNILPEPATLGLMALGGLAMLVRRKHGAATT